MKTFTLSILLIFCFVINTSAQWTEQPVAGSFFIYSISAVDNNIVWAAGDGGRIFRTSNSGLNWISLNRIYYTAGSELISNRGGPNSSGYHNRIYYTAEPNNRLANLQQNGNLNFPN